MTIGIILHPYGEQQQGGLGRTMVEWTRALLKMDRENRYVIFLKEKPQGALDFAGNNWQVEVLGPGFGWLDRLAEKTQCDVYLFNTPVLPFRFKPKKTVVIVQDFPYKHLPSKSIKESGWRKVIGWYHGRSMRRADRLVAVSDATKQDILRFYRIPEEKISVVHLGFKRICQVPEQNIDLPDHFFFFAGTVKERKNVMRIVQAFAAFRRRYSGPFAVVIGGKNEGAYARKIQEYARSEGIEKDVMFLGYLNDGQLSYVYKHADALVFPSLVEGFGMPVVEAMDCGTPVITSNVGGPAETGADGAAILVDPYRSDDIANAMLRIARDPELRQELIRKGYERAPHFTWDVAAKGMLRVLRETAKVKTSK